MIPYVDCQGLAGAWTLGTLQTGKFRLIHRTSLPGGFGDEVLDANRPLLASKMGGENSWEQETGEPFKDWTPQEGIGYLNGTPPCSGFSLLNQSRGKSARGPESTINSCMRELVGYAGRCTGTDGKRGPEVVSFESVQGAHNQGRVLMQALRAQMEMQTHQEYDLTHVLMSGASVGAAQMRHRYFFVIHRIPFGVDLPEERQVETYSSAIGDLQGAPLQWEDQAYPRDATSGFQRARRRLDGQFDAHVTIDHGRMVPVIKDIAERGWNPGETMIQAVMRQNYRPPALERAYNENWEAEGMPNPYKGWRWPTRIRPDRSGYVLTGGGVHDFIHWSEDRLLSVRECARLMGYTDEWQFPTNRPMQASMWIGKCCPVNSGEWISNWVARAHEGNPGAPATEVGDREYRYNCTLMYKKWPGGNPPKQFVSPTEGS